MTLLGFRLALRRWTIPERWAHPVMAMIGGVLLFTNFLHLYLVSEPHQTTNLLVDVVGAGFLMLSTGWLALFILTTLLGWGSLVLISPPSPVWLYYAFALTSAAVLAVLVHVFRLRTLRRLETVRIQDQSRAAELEAALAATKASQMKLRESEVKFRMLAETITAGIFIYQGTKMRYVNSAAERISGYTREELLAMDFWEVIHPEFQALVKERGLARQRSENVPLRYEVKILTKDGESRWIDFTVTRTEFEGKPAVLGTALDITARKQTEEALQQSEARYRTLVENSPAALYVHRDGKLLYANPASARLVGASHPQQLIGKSVIDFVATEYRPLVAERMQRIMQEGITLPFIEVKGSRLDGAAIEVETMGLPIIYQGQPAAQVIVRDITERKQMEKQLQRYANDLEKMVEARAQRIHELEKQQIENEKLAATGRMAARMAHEINNPLGMIQTAFRLVSNSIPQEHRHHHYVDKIEKEIDRIAQIVRQMLDLHKPHQESPKRFRADEAIGEVIALMKPKFHKRNLSCEQELQQARKTIALPENMLRQVLYNVMLNAVEASPP